MVIIGILASLGIGNFISSQMKARDSRRKQDLKHIATAVELFYNDYGYFPSGTGEIEGCGSVGSEIGCNWGEIFTFESTTYMVQLPLDPHAPSSTYFYESDGSYYVLYAYLENDRDPDLNEGVTTEICATGAECNYAISSSNHQL